MMKYQAPRFPATNLPLPTGHRHRLVKDVAWALYSASPLRSIKKPGSNTAAQKAGKRYEARVYKSLEVSSLGRPLKAPWIHYSNIAGAEYWAQPDAILFRRNYAVLLEIKLTHTVDAYWQLRHQYLPLMSYVEPGLPIHLCELTRSFDPSVSYPEEMRLYFDMQELLEQLDSESPGPLINVLQWKL